MAKGESISDDTIQISVGAMNVIEDVIAQIDDMVRSARAMPLSNSAMVPRQTLLDLIETLKRSMPEEITRARALLRDAESVLEGAKVEAERTAERARADREKAIGKTEIAQAAAREAESLVAEAEAHAKRIKAEAEQYVEGKLANFEVALQKTLKAVERGRARLAGRLVDQDQIAGDEEE